MKNTMITLVSIATLSLTTISVSAFNSGTNEFEITPVENLHLGKNIEKVWKLTYFENEKPVTITLNKGKHENEFVVRGEFFEVAYVSSKSGFGVRAVRNSQREVPEAITSSVLNAEQMQKQKILTADQISDEYAMQLIASYLPDLLNENYKHLIY